MVRYAYPTAPVIKGVWVENSVTHTDAPDERLYVRKGKYYYEAEGDFALSPHQGHFKDGYTEYWPTDFRKAEVQNLQESLAQGNIRRKELNRLLEKKNRYIKELEEREIPLFKVGMSVSQLTADFLPNGTVTMHHSEDGQDTFVNEKRDGFWRCAGIDDRFRSSDMEYPMTIIWLPKDNQ